jgi:hypothetical protein
VEEILHRAERLEKGYDWVGAAESYEKALGLVPEHDFSRKGETYERLGYALYRVAFQAESSSDFRERMRRSVEEYGKAAEVLAQIAPARALYCKAMARYSDYWSVEDASQKKRSLDDCWRLLKEALDGFAVSGDGLGYGKAFHRLAFCLWDRAFFAESLRESKEIVEEAVRYGQTAVTNLSEAGSVDELAWAYTMTSFFMLNSASALMISNLDYFEERRTEFLSLISEYLKKAGELRDRIEDVYFQFFLDWTLWADGMRVKGDLQVASKWGHNLLSHAERAKDHYLLAGAYYVLNDVTETAAITEEDPDKKKEQHNLAIKFAEESIHQNLLIRRYDWVAGVYSYWLVESHFRLAELETSVEEKRALLKRAVEAGRKGNEYAKLSGSLGQIEIIYHELSKALYFLSKTEMNVDEKKRLLGEALELRKKRIEISSKLMPPNHWFLGVSQNYLALIKTDLAEMEEFDEQKRRLLEEAVSSMEKCIAACTRYVEAVVVKPLQWYFGVLGWYHDWFGEVLDRLYALTKDGKIINKAIGVSQGAVQVYQKAGMPSRVAEAYWRAARLHDQLSEYIKSAEDFESASRTYQLVAERIPQLKEFYQEHALYMQAWSEIERARHHHERQEYGLAKEHFEKAADIHKSLRRWSYLEPNYSAWTRVEDAEELSRKEQGEEAIKAFEYASKLFTETKKSVQTQLSKIEDNDEKQMATGMIKASDVRKEYCEGRIAVEEAKILDKKGDHYSSSEKYGSAADAFEKMSHELESEQDRKELRLIISLSRAWQKMTLAEARSSPALYLEASQVFEQAEDLSPNEKTRMLLLGHSRFCRALEAGTRFADSRDATLHQIAEQHLESAANYYVRAGFQNASEYSKAMEHLFDAYLYMDDAKREKDPEKKARLYIMAEKVLQTSAGSFMKAEHPEKREQVSRLLDKVREEKELALSLSEVLHAPSIVSTTTAFTAPSPNQENAVGLERFENADVRANLIIRQKELRIGENLSIELELVNAGKGFALLTKVTEIIPKGFELAEKPENCRVEDSYLNLKGKRLDPLKTEEVKLVLKPTVQGTFSLKPTVLYLDENGKYKSHEPEPVTIVVRELGIKSWLKGER